MCTLIGLPLSEVLLYTSVIQKMGYETKELRAHLKEQEIYLSKELVGKGNEVKWMYEPPPGFVKKEHEDKTKV